MAKMDYSPIQDDKSDIAFDPEVAGQLPSSQEALYG